MADGSIVFPVDMDDSAAQKRLNELRKEIEKTAKAIDKTSSDKSGIERQLDSARESAKALQKEMDAIQEARASAARAVSENAPGRARFSAVDPVAYAEAAEQMRELDAKAAELAPKIKIAEKDVAKLEAAEQRVNDKLAEQTAALEQQKEAYGAQARVVEQQATSTLPAVRAAADQSAQAIKRGFKNILKWGFGIRSVFVLMRRLRSAIKEGIAEFAKADPATKATLDSLKNMLQTLKASWGAAFAPIIQAVAPILQKLIGWLTTAANAVQQFFAVLSGKTTYKVAKANQALADSYGAAGGAAKDAQKQIMGFDEINKLNEESSGGGGAAADASNIEYEERALEAWTDKIKDALAWISDNMDWLLPTVEAIGAGFLAWKFGGAFLDGLGKIIKNKKNLLSLMGLTLTVTGLVLEWDAIKKSLKRGLNGKTLAQLLTGALLTTAGAALLGKAFGNWAAGAIIGGFVASAGVITAGIGSAIKNGVSWKEALAISGGFTGLGAAVGGAIGMIFVPGGPAAKAVAAGVGALVGLATGLIATGITAIATSTRKKANEILDNSELWQGLQESKKRISEMLSSSADLVVHVQSISADIDENTLINLNAAAALIDEIFNLDAKDNKTAEEIAVIQQKIEALNSMGLPGINLAFDEASGHVRGTRDQVIGLLEDLKQQYQLEAMKQAYIDYYRAQSDAEIELQNLQNEKVAAYGRVQEAINKQTDATNELRAANEAYTQAKIDLDVDGMMKWASAVDDARAAVLAATDELSEAEDQYGKIEEAIKNSNQAIVEAADGIVALDEKFKTVKESATTAGADTMAGFASGITDNEQEAIEALRASAQGIIEAAQDELDIHSPSRVTAAMGEDLMAGFAEGISRSGSPTLNAIITILDEVKSVFQRAISDIAAIWQSDVGHPHIQLPIFSLSGRVNFQTGEVPQLGIAGWRWLAKGGILNRATLIGAGEAGKEAVLPLERNTGWIKTIADGILDRMEATTRFADYITGRAMPSFVTGHLVPPRALGSSGGMFTDGDIEKLVSGIASLLGDRGDGDGVTNLYLDSKLIAKAVTKRQREMERSYGV